MLYPLSYGRSAIGAWQSLLGRLDPAQTQQLRPRNYLSAWSTKLCSRGNLSEINSAPAFVGDDLVAIQVLRDIYISLGGSR